MKSNAHSLMLKLCHSSLQDEEWKEIFDHLDRDGNIEWLFQDDKDRTHFLLRFLRANPEQCVVDLITQHHGNNVWQAPDRDGQTALSFLLQNIPEASSGHKKEMMALLAAIIPHVPREAVEQWVAKEAEDAPLLNQPSGFWAGPLHVPAFFLQHNQVGLCGTWMQQYPDVRQQHVQGHSLSTMLSSKGDGFDVYLKAGGSIFDTVRLNPTNHQLLDERSAMPLWVWLKQSKSYNAYVENHIKEVLQVVRGTSNTTIHAFNDAVVGLAKTHERSLQDWMDMMAFEKDIKQDWKKAIKGSRAWRKWRSAEGANFAHWLAVHDPVVFCKKFVTTRLNHKLIVQPDDLGRSIAPYLLVGLAQANYGSYRRQDKNIDTVKDSLKNMIEQKMLPTSPVRGVLYDWSTSLDQAFFQSNLKTVFVNRSSVFSKPIIYLLEQQPQMFFNGLDQEWAKNFLKNTNHFSTLGRFISDCVYHCSTRDSLKHVFQELPEEARFALLLSCLPTMSSNVFIQEMIDGFGEGDHLNFSWDELNTVQQNVQRHYSSHAMSKMLAIVDKQMMVRKVAELAEQEPDVAPEPARRRKM